MKTRKPLWRHTTRFFPLCLCILTYASLSSSCTLEEPAYSEYAKDGEFIQCPNVTSVVFEDGTSITANDPVFEGKDYSPAFQYGMCPEVAPICVTSNTGSSLCTSSCQNNCYNVCVNNFESINIVSCDNPDGKTIECAEGTADCDGNISNGCEFDLATNHTRFCVYNHETKNSIVTCMSDDYTDCDGNYKNGCEYQLSAYNAVNCADKQVTCDYDHADCDSEYLTGCEIDITTNNKHCGFCGNVCNQGSICSGGECGLTCQSGLENCFGTCIFLASNQIEACTNIDKSYTCKDGYVDHNREGFNEDGTRTAEDGCEYSLSEKHVAAYVINEEGTVELTCASDWADCNNNPDDGCEVNLIAAHARSCSYEDGKIIFACTENFGDLNNESNDGCEFQFDTHSAMGYTRGDSNEVILQCVINRSDCDGNYENGCEYDLKTANAKTCVYTSGVGVLTCRDGYANFNGDAADGCEINGGNDRDHCGAQDNHPGTKCDAGYVCSGGKCAQACGGGLTDCNGICISFTDTNVSACSAGKLICSDGYANCDNKVSNGCEIDIKGMDAGHCGSCGKEAKVSDVANSSAVTCSTGQVVATACKAGYILKSDKCEACAAGQYTISGTDTQCIACPLTTGATAMTSQNNICKAKTCAAGYYLSGNNCVACTTSDVANSMSVTSAAGSTAKTACKAATCKPGFILASGACTACSDQQYSAGGTSASCTTCPANTSANSDHSGCQALGCSNTQYFDGNTCKTSDTSNCGAKGLKCSVTTGASTMECATNTCRAKTCQDGYLLSSGNCTPCALTTSAASMTTASGSCKAKTCQPGYKLASGAGTACAAGTSSAGGTATACSNCAANTYSTQGAAVCTACPTGSYSAAGSASCNLECTAASQCTKGTGVNTMTCNSNKCVVSTCNAGYYLENGACVACPAGTYKTTSDALGITSCTACASGTYSNSTARTTSCTSCPAGKYAPTSGNTACAFCPAGTYSGSGASTCSLCGIDQYSSGGASSCSNCTNGKHSYPGSASCTLTCISDADCSDVSISQAGHVSCIANQCVATTCLGSYYLSSGQCLPCPAGTGKLTLINGDSGDITSCTPCSAGSYSNTPGSRCISCPAGTYSSSTGATSCTTCNDGYISTAGSTSCTACANNRCDLNHTSCVSPSACPSGLCLMQLDGPGHCDELIPLP